MQHAMRQTDIEISKIKMSDQPMPLLPVDIRNNLKESIKNRGVIYPLLVETMGNGTYKIIDGRNRWDLSKELGLQTLPCFVVDSTDPFASVMMYEVELYRRSLSDEEREKVTKQMKEFTTQIIETKFTALTANLIPEIRKAVRDEHADQFKSEKGLTHLSKLAGLEPKYQKLFVQEMAGRVNVNDLQTKIAEKETEIDDLKVELKEKKELEKKLALLESGFAKQIEKRLAEKEKEIELKYKDMQPGELSKLLAVEKKKIEDSFKAEIEEHQKNKVEISKAKDEATKKLEDAKTRQSELSEEKKTAEKLAAKYKTEVDSLQKALDQVNSPAIIVKKLDSILADIHSFNRRIDALHSEAMIVCKGIVATAPQMNGKKGVIQSKVDGIIEALNELSYSKVADLLEETVKSLK